MRFTAPLLVALAALTTPVAAQVPAEDQSLSGLAVDLAYGFCPQFMNGETALASNAALMARGFEATPKVGGNARFPDFALLGQSREDGDITVGGIPNTICQVTVIGPQAAAALSEMRGSLGDLGIEFEADPANSGAGPRGNGTVETLKLVTPGSEVIRVQFLQAVVGTDTPLASFQIMAQER